MISSKFTPPWPSERKSQPRCGSPKFEWLAKDAAAAVERHDRVLHVDVVDAVGERADELDRIDALPDQVARIEIEAELLAVVQRIERPLGRVQVEGDFRRMHLQGKLHAALAEHVENRVEPLGQQLETVVDHLGRNGRERIQQRPDARSGEAVDHADAQLLRGLRGVDHVLRRPGIDLRRLAVAPYVRRQNRLVTLVDVVQHRLADQVVADGEHLEVVLFQQFAFLGAVVVLVEGLIDLEVIAPAGQFQPVVSEAAAFSSQFGQGQVGPLARKYRDRSSHVESSFRRMTYGENPRQLPSPAYGRGAGGEGYSPKSAAGCNGGEQAFRLGGSRLILPAP